MSKVLLVYPASNPEKRGTELDNYRLGELPIGLMSLAGFLESRGHIIRVIDARAYPKDEVNRMLKQQINDADCVGLSVMSIQVKHALALTQLIKENDRDMPVVWGGIHPTLFPEQTANDPLIDYVIHGEGEYAFLKLLEYLEKGTPELAEIDGLAYKDKGRVKINKPSPPLDTDELPDLAYHLFDIERYINKILFTGKRVRTLSISTSRGCPYRCSFCVNRILVARKWRPLSQERVFNTIDSLVEKYQLNHLYFIDDYFFGKIDRVKQIAEHLAEKDYNLLWEANIRANNFCASQVDDECLKLLKRSGCYSLRMGAESGSDRVLEILKKDITVENIINAVEECKKHDIIPLCYFMTGIPGETLEEAKMTFSLIVRLYRIYPKIRVIVPGLFRPYPGGELYDECIRLGFKEPKSLREWGDVNLDSDDIEKLPWIKDKLLLNNMRDYIRFYTTSHEKINPLYYPFLKTLGKMAGWRFDHDFWSLPIEPVTVNFLRNAFEPEWRGTT
jgi:anaerobic magnesium-protoporphyrin IX monomethyl ester cyclase